MVVGRMDGWLSVPYHHDRTLLRVIRLRRRRIHVARDRADVESGYFPGARKGTSNVRLDKMRCSSLHVLQRIPMLWLRPLDCQRYLLFHKIFAVATSQQAGILCTLIHRIFVAFTSERYHLEDFELYPQDLPDNGSLATR